MNNTQILEKAFSLVKSKLSQDTTGHDQWHALRVWNLTKKIAANEQCDTFVAELAAILHDIDDWKFSDGDTNKGSDVAKNFLLDLEVSENIAEQVSAIVNNISYKGANTPEASLSIEGKIVQDADRLDAIGAIGIARTFACGNAFNRKIYEPGIEPVLHKSFEEYKNKNSHTINHFYEKLLLLKDRLHTQTAKEIAKERHQFMEEFLAKFHAEWSITKEAL